MSETLGFLDPLLDPKPSKLITLDARLGFSGSPSIGAEVEMGEPGTAISLRVEEAGGAGLLYV